MIINQMTKRKVKIFKRNKLAVISIFILLFFSIATFIAPYLANSRPIVMSYRGKIYYPIIKDYQTRDLEINDGTLKVDYKNLVFEDRDWSLWPPIQWDPYESNSVVENYPSAPTKYNLFGTDDRGRDILTRLLYGFKYSIIYSICVWLISTFIGIIVGAVTGYYGGKVDFIGQRFVEVLSTIPQFFIILILISVFTPSLTLLVFISSIFSWIGISYYIRGEFLKNRNIEYVEGARAIGLTNFKIIYKHILPNSLTPIITLAPFIISANIVGLASLDFLGFGLEIPTPSWGELLAQAQKNYTTAWWLALFPSLSLFGVLVVFNLIGDALRDAFDPRSF